MANLSNKLGYDISIDSHSSKINNARLIHRFAIADERNVMASNSPTIENINNYFNELDCIFINVGSVLIGSLNKSSYELILQKIHDYKRLHQLCVVMPTLRRAFELLEITKQLNMLLTSAMQELQFFFRMGTRSKKGLQYVDQLYRSGVPNETEAASYDVKRND